MSTDGYRTWPAYTLVATVAIAGGVAFGQNIGKFAVPPQGGAPRGPIAQPQSSKQQADRKNLIAWFTKYDEIRHNAQMTPQEKSIAHALMAALVTQNDADKAAGKALLAKMVTRYAHASAQLKALPPLPQTRALQDGFQHYFDRGYVFFKTYLAAVDGSKPEDALTVLQNGKHELGSLNMNNKALDRKLRKQFNIAPYPYD